MNIVEENYSELLEYALGVLRKCKESRFDAADVVNDLYIHSQERTIKSLEEARKFISARINDERREFTFETNQVITGDEVCIKCKEPKPVGAFRVKKRKSGYTYLSSICRVCESKIGSKWRKDNKQKAAALDKRNWKNKIKNLSDVYIKVLLRRMKSKPPITKENIAKKKMEIYLLRKAGKKQKPKK